MSLSKKPMLSILYLAATQLPLGLSVAQAQDAGSQVSINIVGAAGGDAIQQNVRATVQALQFSGRDVKGNDHKANRYWKSVSDALAQKGEIQVLSEARGQTATATVNFSAWPDKPLLADGAVAPVAWSNMSKGGLEVAKEVDAFDNEWKTLSSVEKELLENKYAFLRFPAHDANDVRTIWICASLPYATEIKKDLKFPTALQPLVNELCQDATAKLFQLTFLFNDWGTTDGNPPAVDGIPNAEVRTDYVLTHNNFSADYIGLRRPFERICGLNTLSDAAIKTSLRQAGWLGTVPTAPGVDIDINTAMSECNTTLLTKIIPFTTEALQHYASQGKWVPGNTWLNTRLRTLADARKTEWVTGEKIAEGLSRDIAATFTLENGYTTNRFVLSRDLNIGKAMAAASAATPLKGPSLIAKLFAVETDAQLQSPWHRELKALPATQQEARKKYLSHLVKLVTLACGEGEVEMSCLADSLGQAEVPENTPLVVLNQNGRLVSKKYAVIQLD